MFTFKLLLCNGFYTPVFAQVWQGLDVVKTARKMLGETNPADSLPGTLRGDFSVEVGR